MTVDPLLLGVGLAHGLLGVVCLAMLRVPAAAVVGVHPAWKPLKFAFSIAVFLVTMAIVVPALTASEGTRQLLTGALASSMILEMLVIGGQAARGRRSHFNYESAFDAVLTRAMIVGIVVLVVAMACAALLATTGPLPFPPLVTAALRASLWIFLFSAVSGFGMGGRRRHSVGGEDGGPGMPLTNWSTTHGDLRVTHFFALHALQILPLLAVGLAWLPIPEAARWTVLGLGVAANAGLAAWTWLRALAGRPLVAPPA